MTRTLRSLCVLAALLALAPFARSQVNGVRMGDNQPVLTVQIPGGPVSSGAYAVVHVCTFPANQVPCTNLATTYTDITLGTPCSTSTQITLAGTNTCTGSADGFGNWGVWVFPGTYSFTITINGASTGPFTVTLSSGGGGGGGMVYPPAGVPNSLGAAWGSSYGVGVSAFSLVQLNGSAQLPNVSGANLTNLPSANQALGNLTGPTAINQPFLCVTVGICWVGSASVPYGQSYFTQLNDNTKPWYVDSAGNFFGASFNTLPSGSPFIGSGALGTTPPPSLAGYAKMYCGDSVSLDCMMFLNGNPGLYMMGWNSASPTTHAIVMSETFPGVATAPVGTVGQPFLSGGASADGGPGPLNLGGGSTIVTGILPVGNLPGSGATTVNGVTCTLGTTCTPFPEVVSSELDTSFAFGTFNTAAPVTLVSSPAATGLYSFSLYAVVTTSFTGCTTLTISYQYTDGNGAENITANLTAVTAGTVFQYTYRMMQSNGTAAITYTPSASGGACTAGNIRIAANVLRLQ